MVCRISCATFTSRVRSPPGSGVSEMRMVSPMPCCSSTLSAAADATMPFAAHAGLGEPEMERVVRASAEIEIDRNEILHRRHLGGQNDAVATEPDLLGALSREQGRLHHRFARHRARVDRIGRARILVHQVRQQLLVERAPIGADAHRLVVLDRRFDNGAELAILLFLEADIAGIDAILVERLGAGRMIGEELVADIVEVADDGHDDAHLQKPLLDVRNGGRRLVAVYRDANELGAGAGERRHLPRRSLDVGGIGIGHGLHDHRRAAAHEHAADIDGDRFATLLRARLRGHRS